MAAIGFSSHAPLPFETKWSMKPGNLRSYLNEIDLLQKSIDTIEIYKGLEVDFIPGITGPDKFSDDLDYTIGSIHFVDQFPDGRRWEIDGDHLFFLEGLERIFHNDIKAVVRRYFALTREMVRTDCPTIIGHLDKIKIQNLDNKFFDESERWYRDAVEDTLDCIAEANTIIEVNTRGLYKKKAATTYPGPWILERMRKKGIPVTISSDAHCSEELTKQFQEVVALLKTCDFESITILKSGHWREYEFNEHGIIGS